MVTGFDSVSNEYGALPFEGDRALDKLTDEVIDGFGDADYQLVLRDQEYPYLDTNTDELGNARHGIDEKGVLRLATIDVEDQVIEAYMTAIPAFEPERREQLEKLAESVDHFNQATGSDWSLRGVLYREDAIYNLVDHDYAPGVYTESRELDVLRASEPFADLSRGFFGGWLEISGRTMLERR